MLNGRKGTGTRPQIGAFVEAVDKLWMNFCTNRANLVV